MIKLISKESNALLPEGKHIVTLKSMTSETAKASEHYTDVTPQLKTVFADANGGQFSAWWNLAAFKRFVATNDKQDALTAAEVQSGKFASAGPEGYAIYKTGPKKGQRVRSESGTEMAMDMLNRLAFSCGIEKGTEIDVEDLVGSVLGIEIRHDGQKNKVYATFKASEAQVEQFNDMVSA